MVESVVASVDLTTATRPTPIRLRPRRAGVPGSGTDVDSELNLNRSFRSEPGNSQQPPVGSKPVTCSTPQPNSDSRVEDWARTSTPVITKLQAVEPYVNDQRRSKAPGARG